MWNFRVKFIVVFSILLLVLVCKGVVVEIVLEVYWEDLVFEGFNELVLFFV